MFLGKLNNNYRMRVLVCAALTAVVASCGRIDQPFEYIHLPGTEPAAGANMPFTSQSPLIKRFKALEKSGSAPSKS